MKLITLIQSAINLGEAKGMALNDILNSELALSSTNASLVALTIDAEDKQPGTIWLSPDDKTSVLSMPDVNEAGLNPAAQGKDSVERIPWGYAD